MSQTPGTHSAWSGVLSNDYVAVPKGAGQAEWPDFDNVGHQISRTTFNGGSHNHKVVGNSNIASSILTATGGSQPFDIRQSYTIVQYIIYIYN